MDRLKIADFIATTIRINPGFRFFFDDTGIEPMFCVEVKRGDKFNLQLPDGAYHNSEGVYYKDTYGRAHTLLSYCFR